MTKEEFEKALAALIAGALHLGLSTQDIAIILANASDEGLKTLPWNDHNG